MPFGYTGQNLPNQTVSNSGVFSISDVADLEKQGKFGGSLELISTTTFSSVGTVDITSGFTGYDVFLMHINNVSGSANINFRFQFYESGTLETGGVYHYAKQFGQPDGGFGESRSTNAGSIPIFSMNSNPASSYVYFYNFTDSSKYSFATFHSMSAYSGDPEFQFGGFVLPQASTVDGVRLLTNTGTASGEIKLYGVKQL
jgi:hypothetical protein